MALTPAQLLALKTAISSDPTLAAFPNTSDGNFDLAVALSAAASPAFYVWQTSAPVSAVFDAITWANLTPSDAPDGTQTWANRSLACQGKQFNLQTILIGGAGTVNASKPSVRAGLQDALTNVPSGASGALVSAGWVAVRDALARPATRAEKIFATITVQQDGSTAAKAATMTIEGPISPSDVSAARSL